MKRYVAKIDLAAELELRGLKCNDMENALFQLQEWLDQEMENYFVDIMENNGVILGE